MIKQYIRKAKEQPPQHHPTSVDVKSALLFCLFHHQGSNSLIGQPIRHALGIGEHQNLTSEQVSEALRVQSLLTSQASDKVDAQEWFSVDDRLPETSMYCLVAANKRIHWAFCNSLRQFAGENTFIDGVTHWMPLPAAPVDATIKEGK